MSSSILVVDDDRDMCVMIRDALTTQGHRVSWALDASSALRSIEAHGFDLVIADVELGSTISGLQLCQSITREHPDVPVVIITAFGSMDSAVAAIRAGACDYITKPLDMKALASTLDRALVYRRLRREVKELRRAVAGASRLDRLLGASVPMKRMFHMIHQLCDSDASVLVTGESGSGKELVARALHRTGPRANGPFVAINCAAMPANLLESELFGHVRGAFTDAKCSRPGLFVKADQGTLFLDEIGEMPPEMQSKLLRVLQERKVRPVGANREIPFDTRIIAATHRNLDAGVQQGWFRQDLYYRLNVVRIAIPPLRARGNDVLLLAQQFIDEAREHTDKQVCGLSCHAALKLLEYDWPGNVRELENCIQRAVTLTRFEQIVVDDLPERIRSHEHRSSFLDYDDLDRLPTLDELGGRYIERVLEATGGNKAQASRILGLNRRTLYRWLERLRAESAE